MNISLTPHIDGYHLTTADLWLCALTFFTAVPFAQRHFELANEPYTAKWGHRILAVIECMPILGALVALIEYCIASIGVFPGDMNDQVFEAEHCVTEYHRLSPEKRQHLEKTIFSMLKETSVQVRYPKIPEEQRGTLGNRNKYCILIQSCTPEEFEQRFQKEAGIFHWLDYFYEGESALHWAVRSGRIELIKHILSNPLGKQLLNRGSQQERATPLIIAMATHFIWPHANREEIVELLLHSQADPNLSNDRCFTPLFVAITTGQLSLTQCLLLHPTATLSFFRKDFPYPGFLSEKGRAVLFIAYQQIESALAEGLQLTIPHKDVHSIIAGYYWRGGSLEKLKEASKT